MVQSKAATVTEYLQELPEDRRRMVQAIRKVIKANVDAGIEEGMSYGMISYHVPLRLYPAGYHCGPGMPLPYAGLASQANHVSIYMMGLYMDPEDGRWFEQAWRAAGKKLDMGKCCVRFKKLEDVPMDVLAEAFQRMPSQRYINLYEANLVRSGRSPGSKSRSTGAKSAAKKAAKKTASNKTANKKAAKK